MKNDFEKIIELECKKCGNKFLYRYKGSGARPRLCANCSEWGSDRYIDTPIPTKRTRINVDETPTIDTAKPSIIDNDVNTTYEQFWNDVISVLSRLDTCRVELCTLSEKLGQYQSGYDKIDQVYYHNMENMDFTNPNDAVKFVMDWKESRKNRRSVKDIFSFIKPIIDSIPYKTTASAYQYRRDLNTKSRIYNDNKERAVRIHSD